MGRFEFEAPPPRGSAKMLEDRGDTSNISVVIRTQGEIAEVFIGRKCVARTPRLALRRWLESPQGSYLKRPLSLRHDGMGVWLEITDHVAPTILTRTAQLRIVEALKD